MDMKGQPRGGAGISLRTLFARVSNDHLLPPHLALVYNDSPSRRHDGPGRRRGICMLWYDLHIVGSQEATRAANRTSRNEGRTSTTARVDVFPNAADLDRRYHFSAPAFSSSE